MQLKFLDELYLNMKGYDLPASLTQWSKYYLHKCKGFIFQFQNFQKIQNFKIWLKICLKSIGIIKVFIT